jgi:hypothetical protein
VWLAGIKKTNLRFYCLKKASQLYERSKGKMLVGN